MLAYQEVLEQLHSFHNFYIPTNTSSVRVLSRRVKNVRILLDILDSPDEKFKIVHITGTSGKGTVANLVKSALISHNFKVGATISPHTTTYLERFQWNHELAPAEELIKAEYELEIAYSKYLEKNDPLSFFDLTFVLSCILFSNLKAEYVVMEAGCGGRYDSTNSINFSEVSIITNVDKDHAHILGNTLEEIAYAKAGIMKKDGLAIVGETRPRLKKVFCDEAIQNHAALFFVSNGLDNKNKNWQTTEMKHNLAIADQALEELNLKITNWEKILDNLKPLPCRFEQVSEKPLIILDGAHNPSKMQSTANQLAKIDKPMIALIGCGNTKDQLAMIKKLSPKVKLIHTTRHKLTTHKAQNPFTLLKQIPKAKRGKAFLDPKSALNFTLKNLPKDHGLIITGSLYLAGELRSHWFSEEEIIKQETSFPK